jgi:hypothetical protein
MEPEEMKRFYIDLASDRTDDVAARLGAGVSPDATIRLGDDKPLRPLIVAAAANGAVGSVSLLLERGAQVDTRDEEGMTALMLAAKGKHREVARALVEAGADPALTGPDGRTALELTRSASIRALLSSETVDDEDDDENDDDGPREMTVAALERFYDRPLPDALRRFVETQAWLPYEKKSFPMPSYRDGVEIRFAGVSEEGVLEVPYLMLEAGDYDEAAAEDLIPFGAIYLTDDYRDAQFLLVDASKPECPVRMFEHETGEFEEVADSIDAFLATVGQSLPEAGDDDEEE